MKKIITVLVVAMAAFFVVAPKNAEAAGAITADEQTILNELNAGVTAGGGTFHLDASLIAQAENALKANDYDAATCKTVVANIQAARQLVIDNSKGLTATSLTDLLKQLPASVRNKIMDHVAAASAAINLKADPKAGLVDSKGKPVITKSNSVVKATGANYTTSLVAFVSLMVSALGAAVLGKKYAAA